MKILSWKVVYLSLVREENPPALAGGMNAR